MIIFSRSIGSSRWYSFNNIGFKWSCMRTIYSILMAGGNTKNLAWIGIKKSGESITQICHNVMNMYSLAIVVHTHKSIRIVIRRCLDCAVHIPCSFHPPHHHFHVTMHGCTVYPCAQQTLNIQTKCNYVGN